MNRLTTSFLVAGLLASAACNKKPGAAGKGSGAAPAAAADTGCPAGAYSNAEGGFCFTLPADLKFTGADDNPWGKTYNFARDGEGTTLSVSSYHNKKYEDQLASVKVDAKGLGEQKAVESGDLPGGRWYYVVSYMNGKLEEKKGVSIAKHADGDLECQALDDTPKFDPQLAACKSMHALP
jgi:hypothetical protein